MFKVIANPDDITNTHTFNNVVDIFNPNLNPPRPTITFNQFINHLKVLYCRDNILNNVDKFFVFHWEDTRETRLDVVKRLIKFIPDDKLWLLHFIAIQRISADNKVQYTLHRFTDYRVVGSSGYYFYLNPGYGVRSQYSYRGDNWETEVNTIFDNYYRDQVHVHTLNAGDVKLHTDIPNLSYYNSIVGFRYQQYILGQGYVNDADGNWLRASQVAAILSRDPNAAIINQAATTDDLHLVVRTIVSKLNKAPLYRCLNYSASPLAYLPWPLTAKGEHNPLLYGVELELATDYTVQNIIDATDEPFFICKQDSSVTGNKRFKYELATCPMSFKAHKKQWAYWFSNLDYDKFDTTNETNNGMHVHIGRTAFADPNHIKAFTWFFTQPAHHDFMKFFSQRDNRSWQDYSPVPNTNPNDSRVRAFRRNDDRVKEMRGCIHFSAKGTIEVRLFRGIVSLAEILKNLEFVDSVLHYTMQGQTFMTLSLKNYIAWLHAQPKNKYVIIKKYLQQTDKLKKLIDASTLLDLIFNQKDPSKIISLIEKAKYDITNDHVTILNQRWKKRIFVLNKETKKLELNKANQSSLSFLDRMLEAKILHGVKKDPMPPPLPEELTSEQMPPPRARRSHPVIADEPY